MQKIFSSFLNTAAFLAVAGVTSTNLPLCAEEVTGEEATFIIDRNVLKCHKAVIE